MRRALTILAFATLAGLAGAAEIYKWTDAEGKVHFSDSPPPGVSDAIKVSIASAPTDPARLEHLDQQAEVRAKQSAMEDQLRDSQQKRAGEEAATKQQDCDAARKRYESGTTTFRRSLATSGERRPLTSTRTFATLATWSTRSSPMPWARWSRFA